LIDRKQAAKQFKEQKVSRGIFAVRCTSTGKVWVGASSNLPATRNGLWFMLRSGTHSEKQLQAEWTAHGEQAFEFEILYTLEDETHALAVHDRLKEEKAIWAARFSAQTLL
jgi:hypothetical protein